MFYFWVNWLGIFYYLLVFKYINIRYCFRSVCDLSWIVLWRMSVRGSLEDIFESVINLKLRFEGKEIFWGLLVF